MSKLKVRYQLLLTALVPLIILGVVLLAISYNAIMSKAMEDAEVSNLLQCKQIEAEFSGIVDQNMAAIRTFASAAATQEYVMGVKDAYDDAAMLSSLKGLDAIFNDGNATAITDATGQQMLRSEGEAVNVADREYFIQAMKILQDEFDINIKYELVGGGSNLFLRSQAEKYNLSDKIIFKGELTHDEIFKWLDEIDIYIQPSMQEGLSRALIEAMSRACPAIASSTGGNPELLESAAIFERGNIKSLVNVVKNFINSDLIKHAEYNFKRAKNFEASKLDSKRREFYMKYRDYALNFKGE